VPYASPAPTANIEPADFVCALLLERAGPICEMCPPLLPPTPPTLNPSPCSRHCHFPVTFFQCPRNCPRHCLVPVPLRFLCMFKTVALLGFSVNRETPLPPDTVWIAGLAVAHVRRCGGEPGSATRPIRFGPCSGPLPTRISLGDGNGQAGAPRPGDGRPGWETADMVGNVEWVARVAMHATLPPPTQRRRGIECGGPLANLPLLADA